MDGRAERHGLGHELGLKLEDPLECVLQGADSQELVDLRVREMGSPSDVHLLQGLMDQVMRLTLLSAFAKESPG